MSAIVYLLAVTMPAEHPWQGLREQLAEVAGRRLRIGLHITVIPPFQTEKLATCQSAIAGVASITTPVEASFDGVGYFNDHQTVYVSTSSTDIVTLNQRLVQTLGSRIQLIGERFQYRPHLTLAQSVPVRAKADVQRVLSQHSLSGRHTFHSVQLYEAVKEGNPDWRWEEIRSWVFTG